MIGSSIAYVIDADLSEREQWPNYADWLLKHMADFKRVFRPRIKQLDASEWVPSDELLREEEIGIKGAD